MNLVVENQLVTLADLRAAWREPLTVSLGHDARRRVAESHELIAEVVAGGKQVSGVNTGFGQLARVRISDDELAHLRIPVHATAVVALLWIAGRLFGKTGKTGKSEKKSTKD